MKKIIWFVPIVTVLVGLAFIFYPEKSEEAKQSLEAAGAVAVQKTISALEERVGKADVALEHYKTALQAKRESLIQIKTLKADCERQIQDCKAAVAEGEGRGSDTSAKQAELKMLEERLPSLTATAEKAESGYKRFQLVLKRKRIELDTLKAKMQSLGVELRAAGGCDAGFALQKACQLENEVRSTCNRLEAELEVQAMDENN